MDEEKQQPKRERRRTLAAQVWEVPTTGGVLRCRLASGSETLIELEMVGNDGSGTVRLTYDAWRSLCDLRNKLRPARAKRATP